MMESIKSFCAVFGSLGSIVALLSWVELIFGFYEVDMRGKIRAKRRIIGGFAIFAICVGFLVFF